ncbi:hypothetical protein [Saccharicrinis fermentans]|uniref:DUF5689 domain-containing protein n=1 Tax=Saccharicrinis fermentans DSM 9555 = JCM 21142 TaxID=869213 RepID=W7Y2I3_9BACT|nr:hypothetical protein [Saccharicrinis fermentans]GAF02162.1 hypothetical protein JCM21142_3789 [Saccharicrinis fermentans DSM 9555 = JCM 21142]
MKKLNILLPLFALLFVVACDEDDYVAPGTVTDVAWYTSEKNNGDYKLNQGDYMSFVDLSQGYESHEWSIETGNYFLKAGFSQYDSLPLFIDQEKGFVTDDATVHILFNKAGINKVRLYNTFNQKVVFNGSEPFEVVNKDGVWVIDTTFLVDVYGDVLPAFKVYQLVEDYDGNIIEEKEVCSITETDMPDADKAETWPSIDVEMGGRLKFVDLTTKDRPTGRIWTVFNQQKSTTSNDSVAIVYFNTLGYTTAKGVGSIKAERVSDDELPSASAVKVIPFNVNVIASAKPFVYTGNIKENEDESIIMNVSGEMKSFSGVEDAFTVHVLNAASGFEENIAAAKAEVNPEDATSIKLKLSEAIYNSDQVYVSYDNTKGAILRADDKILENFGPVGVDMYTQNFADVDFYGAEAGGDGWFIQHANQWFINTEKSSSGSYGFKYVYDTASSPGNNAKIQSTAPNVFGVEEGEYLMSLEVWMEESSNIAFLRTNLSTPDWLPLTWDLSSIEKGKWVRLTQQISLGDHSKFIFQINKADVLGDNAIMYIDDIEFTKLEMRP